MSLICCSSQCIVYKCLMSFDLIEILVILGAMLLAVLEMMLMLLHLTVLFCDAVRVSLDTTIYGLVSSLTVAIYLFSRPCMTNFDQESMPTPPFIMCICHFFCFPGQLTQLNGSVVSSLISQGVCSLFYLLFISVHIYGLAGFQHGYF